MQSPRAAAVCYLAEEDTSPVEGVEQSLRNVLFRTTSWLHCWRKRSQMRHSMSPTLGFKYCSDRAHIFARAYITKMRGSSGASFKCLPSRQNVRPARWARTYPSNLPSKTPSRSTLSEHGVQLPLLNDKESSTSFLAYAYTIFTNSCVQRVVTQGDWVFLMRLHHPPLSCFGLWKRLWKRKRRNGAPCQNVATLVVKPKKLEI